MACKPVGRVLKLKNRQVSRYVLYLTEKVATHAKTRHLPVLNVFIISLFPVQNYCPALPILNIVLLI